MKAFSLPYPTEPVPDLNDLSRLTQVEAIEPHLTLYTTVLWHVSLKRKIRLALLLDTRNPNNLAMYCCSPPMLTLMPNRFLTITKPGFKLSLFLEMPKATNVKRDEKGWQQCIN